MKPLFILGALITLSQVSNAQYTYSRYYDFGVVPIGIQRVTIYNDGGASYGVNYKFSAQMAAGSDPAFSLLESGCRDDGTQILCGATIMFLPTRAGSHAGKVTALSEVQSSYTNITLNLVGTGVIPGPENPDFKACDAQRRAQCEALGRPNELRPFLMPILVGQTIDDYYQNYPNAPTDREMGATVSFNYNCIYTNPSYPGEYNYASGLLGVCSYVVGPKNEESVNLSIPSKPFAASPSTVANQTFSVKPDQSVDLFVKVNGTGIPDGDSRSAQVKLIVGTDASLPPQNVSLADIKAGRPVKFPYQFSAEQAGELSLSAEVIFSGDSNSSDNFSAQGEKMYVLCSVADKGVDVPFEYQTKLPWGPQGFGNTANSANPGTMAKYGCSVTAFAMLIKSTKYNIKNVPLGSPANPAPSSPANIDTQGILGEPLTPGTLNWAFRNYKKTFNTKGSVALNEKNNPIWEGMAEVAQAGYKYQCSIPANNCNPANSKSSVTKQAIKFSGFDSTNNSIDQKLVMKNICSGNPVILKFKSKSAIGQHYVLAKSFHVDNTGQIRYILNDPGTLGGQNVDQATEAFRNKYPYIMGYSLYKPEKDPSMMTIFAPLNVHFLVTDPLGRKSGYDPRTGLAYSQIPGADYGAQVINSPSETGVNEEVLVAERVFSSTSDTPVGSFSIQTFANESGNYYLDVRKSDQNGHLNDTNYFSGNLAAGQSAVNSVLHTQEIVPEVNGTLSISNFTLNKREKGLLDVGIIFGGRVKPLKNQKLTMTNKFTIVIGGINGFKFEVPFLKFKLTKLLGAKIYTYLAKDVKVILLESGDFEIVLDKSNLQYVTAENAGNLRIDIDSISADAKIELKCSKNVCVKAGK